MSELRFGPWVVEETLGRGGFATGHLVRHTETSTLGVLKVMHDELASKDEQVARFRREARLMSVMSPGPGRVRMLDAHLSEMPMSWRGLIKQVSHETLGEVMQAGSMTLYSGFDPTAPAVIGDREPTHAVDGDARAAPVAAEGQDVTELVDEDREEHRRQPDRDRQHRRAGLQRQEQRADPEHRMDPHRDAQDGKAQIESRARGLG